MPLKTYRVSTIETKEYIFYVTAENEIQARREAELNKVCNEFDLEFTVDKKQFITVEHGMHAMQAAHAHQQS